MKLKRLNFSAHFLIMIMVALVLGLTIQLAQAQTVTTVRTGSNYIESKMPTKAWGKKILENTSLSYYQSFSGPTVSGAGGQTYNIYQDARSPMQSFHSLNLRYSVNTDWAVGATLAATSAYGDTNSNNQTGVRQREIRDEFYNARLYVSVPSFQTKYAKFSGIVAYEAPTSVFARQNDMTGGLVIMPAINFVLPNPKWSLSILGQYYRKFFEEDVLRTPGFIDSPRQTVTANFGPYLSYNVTDKFMMTGSLNFDWDQRGEQTYSRQFNSNMPDTHRLSATYFPGIKHFTSIGLFTQGLLNNYSTATQMIGAELALKL